MGEIIISKAPEKYQPYLQFADQNIDEDKRYSCSKKGNGKIDCWEEARLAAEQFLCDNYDGAAEITKYFRKHGMANPFISPSMSPTDCLGTESVEIKTAPQQYRPYLTAADENSTGASRRNGKLDSDEEVRLFIDGFMEENIGQRRIMLDYLARTITDLSLVIDVDTTEAERRPRILLSLYLLSHGYTYFDYQLFSDEDRYVPPHRNDLVNNSSAETNPVDVREKKAGREYIPSFQLAFDAWQYVTLGYQLSFHTADIFHERWNGEHSQRYVSPEDAYTFVSLTRRTTHSFTLAAYPYVNKWRHFFVESGGGGVREDGSESSILVEGGLAWTELTLARGWHRFSAAEVMDKISLNYLGGRGGVFYQYIDTGIPERVSYTGGYKVGISMDYYNKQMYSVVLDLGFIMGLNL
jgi:hypothetical protein